MPDTDDASPQPCRVTLTTALSRIGDKWTIMVIGQLADGPKRFSAMAREIEGISQRMLTLTLRNLERDGLVTRTAYATVPPRVDYALTDLGRTLIAPLTALFEWARIYLPVMDDARRHYEERIAKGTKA